ncbi:hypothetical protein, partial [Nocardia thailandica]|uniref:hypothetical protein n=1 Tax=Nocardia thailandica TaxID=257275 RepID=UPI0005B9B662
TGLGATTHATSSLSSSADLGAQAGSSLSSAFADNGTQTQATAHTDAGLGATGVASGLGSVAPSESAWSHVDVDNAFGTGLHEGELFADTDAGVTGHTTGDLHGDGLFH